MKPRSQRRSALALLAIALLLTALALALGATEARASDGGMAGMPGMTDAEMQNMTPPAAAATPAPAATAAGSGSMSGSGATSGSSSMQSGQAMAPNMDMGGGSINWFVIGGFIVLVAGSTVGAMATKRHLARSMAAGELAGAGALDV